MAKICMVVGCDYRARGTTYCDAHYQRMRRGVPIDAPLDRRDKPSTRYKASHVRIRATRGLASQFQCVDCGCAAREWAYNGDDKNQLYDEQMNCFYSLDAKFYDSMCIGCHRRRDLSHSASELREYRIWKHKTGLTLAEYGESK